MNESATAYPLTWPDRWPRSKTRLKGEFKRVGKALLSILVLAVVTSCLMVTLFGIAKLGEFLWHAL
jgi:hypothetical protein